MLYAIFLALHHPRIHVFRKAMLHWKRHARRRIVKRARIGSKFLLKADGRPPRQVFINGVFTNFVTTKIKGVKTMSKPSQDNELDSSLPWDDLQRARNRLNSKRTRDRERSQIERLESQKERIWVSNDAIKYQNAQMREAIRAIHQERKSPMSRQNAPTHAVAPVNSTSLLPDVSSANRRSAVGPQRQSHQSPVHLAASSLRNQVGLGPFPSFLPDIVSNLHGGGFQSGGFQGGHEHLASLMLAARDGANPFYPTFNNFQRLQYASLPLGNLGSAAFHPGMSDFPAARGLNAARLSKLPVNNSQVFQNARILVDHLHGNAPPQPETSIGSDLGAFAAAFRHETPIPCPPPPDHSDGRKPKERKQKLKRPPNSGR
jgi:hypothetical protein